MINDGDCLTSAHTMITVQVIQGGNYKTNMDFVGTQKTVTVKFSLQTFKRKQ